LEVFGAMTLTGENWSVG